MGKKILVSIFICCSQHKICAWKVSGSFITPCTCFKYKNNITSLERKTAKKAETEMLLKNFSFHIKLHTKTAHTNQCACVLPLFLGIILLKQKEIGVKNNMQQASSINQKYKTSTVVQCMLYVLYLFAS